MPSTGYLAAALAIAATITFALRSVPFAVLRPLRGSWLIGYLGAHMPAGVMVILVVYLLRDVTLDRRPYGLPEAAALLVTVGLYIWRRNGVLGILVGTPSTCCSSTPYRSLRAEHAFLPGPSTSREPPCRR